jgi:hypothetical protein
MFVLPFRDLRKISGTKDANDVALGRMEVVADLGVAMGPRNQRRLVTGAIASGAIAALVAGGLLLHPFNQSGPASSGGSVHVASQPKLVTQKLIYGMTKAQVVRRVGQPTRTVGACWQYDENLKIRNGEDTVNAERVCFLGGVYSYNYSKMDGTWEYPTTPLVVPKGLG